ncbi:unnamed protein product [Amaranthus hypochondriacus]
MVLRKDDRTTVFSEDSNPTFLASESRRGQKGLGIDNDGSSVNRKVNDAKEVFSSSMDKDDRSGSCEIGQLNNFGQEAEAVDSRTNSGSPNVDDKQPETRKLDKSSQLKTQRLSMSSSYKYNSQNEKVMQSNEVTDMDERHESSLQASLGDDVDDSDVEEEDVKVCDICGDAGREDLLAVCSRCSDGAEHTYCMREMLDKVPEGDWLCEECKYNKALEARRQENIKLLGSIERNRSLGRTNSANSDVSSKLENKDSFSERKPKIVSLNKQLSTKRSGDSIETGPTAKKQVLESSTGSPTTLSPNRVPVLSRDFSFKNVDKMKGKSTSQLSTGAESAGDSSENTRSPTKNPKGNNLMKSNSFNSSNLKASVRASEEVQKKRLAVDPKDGPGKFIGKSMSFKGLGRSSVIEPKVKMLSPKCAPAQDLKGQKPTRERSSFERKNTLKLDNTLSVQTTANTMKRLSRVDSLSTLSVSSRDYKNAQSDGNSTSLSKQASHVTYKSPDTLGSLGEVKRQSSTKMRGAGTSSSAEAKASQISMKDGLTLDSSRAADGSFSGSNGANADAHDNQSEKALENTLGRSKQGANGALVSGSRRRLSSDASTLRAKGGVHEENKLKAAIEAAMQKKQDIFKKNKLPEKVCELSMSNTHGNHVGDTVSIQGLDSIPEEVDHAKDTVVSDNTSNSFKHISISAKQLKVYPANFSSSSEEDPVLAVSAIPELESIWQGVFEIHRNGKHPDICGGFQAHLSSFASDKVLEVVRKFPQKIVFNEVARSCAWPFQSKEVSAKEDNIAMYFFAKDLESYLKSYKVLLEYMMKHDLALKGNINGVELLVFPSNHLAHASQRWNTLFFMWGVFRGRRGHYSVDRGPSLVKPESAVSVLNTAPRVKDVSSVACLPENSGLRRPAIEELSVSGGKISLSSPISQVNPDKRPEKHTSELCSEARSESGTSALEDQSRLDRNIVARHRHSMQEVENGYKHDSKEPSPDMMLDKCDISSHSSKVHMLDRLEGCSDFASEKNQVLFTVSKNYDRNLKNSLKQDQYMDNIQKNRAEVKLENNEDQEEKKDSMLNAINKLKWDKSLKQEGLVDINVSADCSMEDLDSFQCSHSDVDSMKRMSEAASVIPCQKRSWMDGKDLSEGNVHGHISKKVKGTDNFYGCEVRRPPGTLSDKVDTQMLDVSTSSRMDDTSNEAVDEKSTSVNQGSAERCFFVVDSHAAPSVSSEDHSSPLKVCFLGNDDRLPDGSPDLELALGVEKKHSKKGVLPFFAGIVDRKGPDRPPDIASPKEEYEEASASLSLSLAFPLSDKEIPARSENPLVTVEQALPPRREANTSLLLFRGSSGK